MQYKKTVQKLAQIEQRESSTPMSIQTKADEIILLEKQGLCSQKLRNNLTGNLAQVTQSFGQKKTDISNIDSNILIKVERISIFSFILCFFYK